MPPPHCRSWGVLREVLEAVAEAGGDVEAYRQRWKDGTWWWWMLPGGRLQHAGPPEGSRFSLMRCPNSEGDAAPGEAAPLGAGAGPQRSEE